MQNPDGHAGKKQSASVNSLAYKNKYMKISPVFFLLFSVIFILASSCSSKFNNDDASDLKADQSPGRIIVLDSFAQPKSYKVNQGIATPAIVVETIEDIKTEIQGIKPHIVPVEAPQKRTPGKGQYLLPEKIEASPVIWKTVPSEVVQLKEPISRDKNPYSFISHGKPQGLSHDDIVNFHEDHQGNMWIGSYGGGIMRFDGNNITHYNKTPGGEIPETSQIIEDQDHNIWVATTKGLYRFDGFNTFFYNATDGGLLHDALYSLQIDVSGNLWMSYWNGGISMFDGRWFHHFSTQQGLSIETAQILQSDLAGNIWVSSLEDGLFLYKDGSFWVYPIAELSENHPMIDIMVDNDNHVWFSLYDIGVIKFDGETYWYYTRDKGFPSGIVTAMIQDDKDRFWFSTWGEGLILWEGNSFKHFRKEHGLASELITDIYHDKNGIVWIGYSGGIARYFGDVFHHYPIQHEFDRQISAIAKDKEGKIWLSADEGGIMSFDGDLFTQYASTTNPEIYMHGFIADSNGDLWLTIDERGIFRFDGKNFFPYVADQLTSAIIMEDGIEDSRGNLWFLNVDKGLIKFDGSHFTEYTTDNGLPSNSGRSISQDHKGNIWVSTHGSGVYMMNDRSITHYTTEDGLGSNYVFVVFEDNSGNMWFGTDGTGITLFDGKSFRSFNTTNGLTDNYIFSITQDNDGNMIFGGRFGLNILTKENLSSITHDDSAQYQSFNAMDDDLLFINHTYEDGFLGVGCNLDVILQDDDQIWIGTNDRLTSFNPQASFYDTIMPGIRINQIKIYNEKIDWAQISHNQDSTIYMSNGVKLHNFSYDGVSPWYYIPQNLKLAHNNNFLTIDFAGISTSSSSKLVYSFMLEGFEQDWNRPGKDNTAHYGNLPSGAYTFRVKAMNRMGLWSEEEKFSFVIMTPWWATWWAWMLYLLAGFLLINFFIRSRERSLVLENQLLDNEVELARKTIEIKQNIIANVSHELRTPLTGIIGLTDILAKTPLNDTQMEYLLTLKQTGNNLREIINQILDYAKIESGEVSLKNACFSIDEIFSHAEKVFESLQQKEDVIIQTRILPGVPASLYGDRGRINQILHNLLYNAIKFTHRGSISLEARVVQRYPKDAQGNEELLIKISVEDTGVGISQEAIKKLFVPFSQIENNDIRNTDSTGLGLAISKKLSALLGGSIGIESKVGLGSLFWFTFKVKTSNKIDTTQNHTDTPADTTLGPQRILLVEDKKVNQLVIKLLLETMGHTVALASHGQEAMDMFYPGKFDAILMDIQMPVMDGITATQELKSKYKSLPPIIGLSANAFEGDRKKYMSLGMDEYITKPVTEESLQNVLMKMCIPAE